MNRLGKLLGGAALTSALIGSWKAGHDIPYAEEIVEALEDKEHRPCRYTEDGVSLRYYGSGERDKGIIKFTSDSISATLDNFEGDLTFNDGNVWDTMILTVATGFEETPSSLRKKVQNVTMACYQLSGEAKVMTTEQ